MRPRLSRLSRSWRLRVWWIVLAFPTLAAVGGLAAEPPGAQPLLGFQVPAEWEEAFWSSPNAQALLKMEPKKVAEIVPTQAGLRHCRCPGCWAEESDEPLTWSIEAPREVTCRRCQAKFPNDKIPARDDKKNIPEEAVEVRPGLTHKYPYHEVEAARQRFPGERLYLTARADYEAREFFAKAALYAALRSRQARPLNAPQAAEAGLDYASLAAVLVLRFAQVYPDYATHVDQPDAPKYLQQADLLPPYRRGYRTAKWDWSGSLDVPLNLVIAYALIRDDPALIGAGRLLDESEPRRRIDRDLFRASAEFVRRQPEEFNEAGLQATRGILAVGRLLDDPALVRDAMARLERFAERGFYHDGFYREGSLRAHRRVLGQIDGWIDRLLHGLAEPPALGSLRGRSANGASAPLLALAHEAGAAVLTDPPATDVLLASWPARATVPASRQPRLLGGVGLARLAVGQGADALDLELRSLDAFGPDRIQRQALRLGIGGRTLLDDLDEQDPLPDGWQYASASRNTVLVDGLNQRESLERAGDPAPGGNFLFFAADPDFQVVTLDDPRAYPNSATRYRQTLVATAGAKTRYALSVFEVQGGLQHDQIFHGPVGVPSAWQVAAGSGGPPPESLLTPDLATVSGSRAADRRWFVQALDAFEPIAAGTLTRPGIVSLAGAEPGRPGVRLHLLGDFPLLSVAAESPDPAKLGQKDAPGRASLVLRRRSANGATLATTFVTLFEPVGAAFPTLSRVGRVASPPNSVVIYVEGGDGSEHLVVNLEPGRPRNFPLADGRTLVTDGLAVRVVEGGLTLAGGSFAELGGRRVQAPLATGRIVGAVRQPGGAARGWFETDTALANPEALAGRVVVIRHGDGLSRAWTVAAAENRGGRGRLLVREEPGFTLENADSDARYQYFPGGVHPGPHQFRIGRIMR